jgi:hypothetical protein
LFLFYLEYIHFNTFLTIKHKALTVTSCMQRQGTNKFCPGVDKQYYPFHTLEKPDMQRNNDEVSTIPSSNDDINIALH